MSSDTKYELHQRLNDLNQKLNDTEEPGKRQGIKHDIEIVKLRMRIEDVKGRKKSDSSK